MFFFKTLGERTQIRTRNAKSLKSFVLLVAAYNLDRSFLFHHACTKMPKLSTVPEHVLSFTCMTFAIYRDRKLLNYKPRLRPIISLFFHISLSEFLKSLKSEHSGFINSRYDYNQFLMIQKERFASFLSF